MHTTFFENHGGDMGTEFFENRGMDMDVDTEIFENRGVDMDMDTEIFENCGVDMDTAWNRCPTNSAYHPYQMYHIIWIIHVKRVPYTRRQ